MGSSLLIVSAGPVTGGSARSGEVLGSFRYGYPTKPAPPRPYPDPIFLKYQVDEPTAGIPLTNYGDGPKVPAIFDTRRDSWLVWVPATRTPTPTRIRTRTPTQAGALSATSPECDTTRRSSRSF